jgi:solute carrier family 35 protein F1/2
MTVAIERTTVQLPILRCFLLLLFAQATVFNLSLLTADVYTLIYGVCVFELTFKWPYLISFFATLVGVFMYTTAPEQPPRVAKPPKTP